MAAQGIGSVKPGSGKKYGVKWDSASRDVYVSWGATLWPGKLGR